MIILSHRPYLLILLYDIDDLIFNYNFECGYNLMLPISINGILYIFIEEDIVHLSLSYLLGKINLKITLSYLYRIYMVYR